jgi:hypothetical protein
MRSEAALRALALIRNPLWIRAKQRCRDLKISLLRDNWYLKKYNHRLTSLFGGKPVTNKRYQS